jgi:hypothetical protein
MKAIKGTLSFVGMWYYAMFHLAMMCLVVAGVIAITVIPVTIIAKLGELAGFWTILDL